MYHLTFQLAAIAIVARLWLLGPPGIDLAFVAMLGLAAVTLTVSGNAIGPLAAVGRRSSSASP